MQPNVKGMIQLSLTKGGWMDVFVLMNSVPTKYEAKISLIASPVRGKTYCMQQENTERLRRVQCI